MCNQKRKAKRSTAAPAFHKDTCSFSHQAFVLLSARFFFFPQYYTVLMDPFNQNNRQRRTQVRVLWICFVRRP